MQVKERNRTENSSRRIQPGEDATELRSRLVEEFQDEDTRYTYAESFLNTRVAAQIKVLREQRGLTQEALARMIGTRQAGVSRLENVNYSAWKTNTLRRLARALGVRLSISFETFSGLLAEVENFERASLQKPAFEQEVRRGMMRRRK